MSIMWLRNNTCLITLFISSFNKYFCTELCAIHSAKCLTYKDEQSQNYASYYTESLVRDPNEQTENNNPKHRGILVGNREYHGSARKGEALLRICHMCLVVYEGKIEGSLLI